MRKISILLFCFLQCVLNKIHAQTVFEKYTVGATRYGRVNDALLGFPAQGIAIGNFPNGVAPLAALHINTNYFALTPYGAGETFRTSSNAIGTDVNAWRLFVGTNNNNNGTERFSLFVPASSNNVFLQASRNNGIMSFNTSGIIGTTHTPYTRISVQGGGAGVNNGFVSMGNNLLIGFAPLDRLHLHQDAASNVRMRFTHTTATNGSTLGINNTGQYMFTQFENQAMIFETTDTATMERFRITQDDRILAFRNTNGYVPLYNAKFEINDRNLGGALSTLTDSFLTYNYPFV